MIESAEALDHNLAADLPTTPRSMSHLAVATAQLIRTRVPHLVRTATVRDDFVGWVVSGRKRLSTPLGETRYAAGQAFIMPRATQWDMLNEPPAGGFYEARLIGFAPQTVERFHDRFGQFAATPAVQGCASTDADDSFVATFSHATAALLEPDLSDALREHRALEVLLLLAERGIVFAPLRELGCADRVHRMVSQRPHAAWPVEELARAFHMSTSTLQRRLGEEGTSASRCVREVRLESAMALLQGTSLQVSEIAARCGYDSHSRFTAAFRQRFGYAPSHLRP
jgi:AraC-like DNA-binding protein